MKFRCERDTLAEAVATAQRTVASRSRRAARCCRTCASLRPTGASSSSAPTSRSRTGCRCRPRSRSRASPSCRKLLGEIVRRLEPGPVTVAVTGDEAVITAGRFTTTLRAEAGRGLPAARRRPTARASRSTRPRSPRRCARWCGPRRRTTCGRSSPACCSPRTAAGCASSPPTRTGSRSGTSRA